MDLARELQDQILGYRDARVPLAALREWLDLHVQAAEEASDAGDRQVDALFGEAYALLAELDAGHRTEPELRAALAASVGVDAANGSTMRGSAGVEQTSSSGR